MNESIGEKGGSNDLRKTKIIIDKKLKKEEQEKEDQEIKELEEKLKKKRFYTLIRTIPLVIGGTTLRAFYDKNREKKELKLEKKKEKKKQQEDKIEEELFEPIDYDPLTESPVSFENTVSTEIDPLEKKLDEIEILSFDDEQKPLEELEFNELPIHLQEKLEKLKSRKIVEEYENTLKELRYELRQNISDYNVLEEDKKIPSSRADKLVDKLSTMIDKMEELKGKISINNLEDYDDNYIYYLIESTFQEFRNGKEVDEIKDSSLYITIADKIDEINKKKTTLNKEVEEKKEVLEEKQKDFESVKKEYYSINQFNKDLLMFQYDQDRLLKEVQEKVRTAETIKEKTVTEVEAMDKQSRRLLRLLTFQMLLPSRKFAKGVASSTAAYLYFVNKIMHPKTTIRKYQVILVKDYSDEILNSIENLESTLKVISKTKDQIDKTIIEIKDKYKDYADILPEYEDILRNLKRIKQEMEEKEYEMKRIKEEQEKELEKNNAKVKTKGEYPVN